MNPHRFGTNTFAIKITTSDDDDIHKKPFIRVTIKQIDMNIRCRDNIHVYFRTVKRMGEKKKKLQIEYARLFVSNKRTTTTRRGLNVCVQRLLFPNTHIKRDEK